MSTAARGAGEKVHRGGRREGFLLVEVLATMTISAFLLAALFSVATLVTRASHRIDDRSDAIESQSRILAALTREIEQVAPIRWPGKGAGFVFAGTQSSLAFGRRTSSGTGETIDAIFLDAGRSGLMRRRAIVSPVAGSFHDLVPGAATVVFGGDMTVRFAFYRRIEGNREALEDSWQAPDEVPAAVRITLRRADGTVQVARVQILTDAETGCGQPERALCGLRPTGIDGNDPRPDARLVPSLAVTDGGNDGG